MSLCNEWAAPLSRNEAGPGPARRACNGKSVRPPRIFQRRRHCPDLSNRTAGIVMSFEGGEGAGSIRIDRAAIGIVPVPIALGRFAAGCFLLFGGLTPFLFCVLALLLHAIHRLKGLRDCVLERSAKGTRTDRRRLAAGISESPSEIRPVQAPQADASVQGKKLSLSCC